MSPEFTYTRCVHTLLVSDYPRQCVKPHEHPGWCTDGVEVAWLMVTTADRRRRLTPEERAEWRTILDAGRPSESQAK